MTRSIATAGAFAAHGANAYCANAANGWSDRLRISNETGRMRRTHLRGHDNILKRVLLHAQHAEISTGLQAWTAHVSVKPMAQRLDVPVEVGRVHLLIQ